MEIPYTCSRFTWQRGTGDDAIFETLDRGLATGAWFNLFPSKVKGWNVHFLSQVGREVLIKAVVQSLHVYVMGCFLILRGLIHDINRLIAGVLVG